MKVRLKNIKPYAITFCLGKMRTLQSGQISEVVSGWKEGMFKGTMVAIRVEEKKKQSTDQKPKPTTTDVTKKVQKLNPTTKKKKRSAKRRKQSKKIQKKSEEVFSTSQK